MTSSPLCVAGPLKGSLMLVTGFRRIWLLVTVLWSIFYGSFYVVNCGELPKFVSGPLSFDTPTWEKVHHYYYLCHWNGGDRLISGIEIVLRGISIPTLTFVVLLVLWWIIRGFTPWSLTNAERD
jgi:hypothetical protein